jgi:hypothetical protein
MRRLVEPIGFVESLMFCVTRFISDTRTGLTISGDGRKPPLIEVSLYLGELVSLPFL